MGCKLSWGVSLHISICLNGTQTQPICLYPTKKGTYSVSGYMIFTPPLYPQSLSKSTISGFDARSPGSSAKFSSISELVLLTGGGRLVAWAGCLFAQAQAVAAFLCFLPMQDARELMNCKIKLSNKCAQLQWCESMTRNQWSSQVTVTESLTIIDCCNKEEWVRECSGRRVPGVLGRVLGDHSHLK